MVLLVTTPTILSALETLPPSRREALSLPTEPAVGAPISHEQLIQLGRYFRERRTGRKTQAAKEETEEVCEKKVKDSEKEKEKSSRSESDEEDRDEHEHEHDNKDENENEKDTQDGNRMNKNENKDEDEDIDPTTASKYTLNTLLRGTKVYVPPPPPKPQPSPEYLSLKARLQAAAEADAYNRLLSPSPSPFPTTTSVSGPKPKPGPEPIFASSSPHTAALHDPTNPDGADGVEGNDPLTPTLVINIFLSVLLTGFSTFWALSHFQTSSYFSFLSATFSGEDEVGVDVDVGVGAASEPTRVLLSLFAALLVGVAEVVVYAAYLRKVTDARERERRVKERKVVVGPVPDPDRKDANGDGDGDKEGDGDSETTRITEKETEEIWGRGVNGGVRRRVRERWDRERGGKKENGKEEGEKDK
ncbi:hypothetical protein VTN00DRAFT_1660 [Thermoascus crustaceus]|uniref:uncharacterized protein n=1 Tax=Thermoascus crustaceus TaxID=5088 RepID=UPI003741F476